MKRGFAILLPALLSGLLSFAAAPQEEKKEPTLLEREGITLAISSHEKRVFELLVPDGKWGEPFYLYSKTGIPYRCYVRAGADLPIACRRTEEGEETLWALQDRKL